MSSRASTVAGGRRGVLAWVVVGLAALALLVWGLQWAADTRFTGPKREAAARVVVIGGAVGLLVAEGLRRWKQALGLLGFAAVIIGVPAALWLIDDRPEDVFTESQRRPLATESELPEPATASTRAFDDVERIDVDLALEEYVSGLDVPIDAVFLDDGTLLVAERAGRVRAISPAGDVAAQPVLDVSDETTVDGERGLLGIAVSPSGRLYVHQTDLDGDNLVVSWRLDGTTAVPSSRLEVLSVEQPLENHNGGGLTFGPDGMLYISLGDGGGVGDPKRNAQATWNRLGTLLRVLPDEVDGGYLIPPDNPFVDDDDVWPEIIAYGLRNPLRIRFDSLTGDLWIGDVGDSNVEEVNLVPTGEFGQNFGWNRLEGDEIFAGYSERPTGFDESDVPVPNVVPVFTYPHDKSVVPDHPRGLHAWRNSITGGVRYRGEEIPGLYGVYLYGDFAAGFLGGVAFDADFAVVDDEVFGLEAPVPVSIVEDGDGEVYVVSLNGTVYRLRLG